MLCVLGSCYDGGCVLDELFLLDIYRPKRCGNNNKDEDNSRKTLNDKNHHASSQKFRQLIPGCADNSS